MGIFTNKVVSYSIAIIFIVGMVVSAMLLEDREIILPEIAAMTIGLWVYKEANWMRQPAKICLAPSITAVIGFLVNQWNIAYIGKVSLTLILMMLFLRIIRSNLAPSIATGLLPVVTNATEWSFVLAVFVFTLLLMLGVLVGGLHKGLEKRMTIDYTYTLVFLGFMFVWITLCWLFGSPQMAVIPPIVVVVYESLQKPMYPSKMFFKQVVVLTLSATIGTVLYTLVDSWILITLLDMVIILLLLRIVGAHIPAAFAFPLLPFVFPASIVKMLPISAFVSSVCLFGAVFTYKKWGMKRRKENG